MVALLNRVMLGSYWCRAERGRVEMVELLVGPPPGDVIAAMAAIPRLEITPSILVTQQGPGEDGRLGPEAAGAILLLQATFATQDGADHFWAAAGRLMELLADAPGFIRRYSFPDGPTITLIALWRTVEDARAFAGRPEHAAAVRGLYREGWQYTHCAAVWELHHSHDRIAFCECGTATPITVGVCSACGTELLDVFRMPTSA
jgi:heme-degrading monooxygenase HmoA